MHSPNSEATLLYVNLPTPKSSEVGRRMIRKIHQYDDTVKFTNLWHNVNSTWALKILAHPSLRKSNIFFEITKLFAKILMTNVVFGHTAMIMSFFLWLKFLVIAM